MHPIELFLKKILRRAYNLDSPAIKLNSMHAPHDNASGMYYKATPQAQKYFPMFEHEF